MELYYYCSYDGSPAGYHIGKVNNLSQSSTMQELSGEHIEPFIRCCFETGLVQSAFGMIPPGGSSDQKYFLLKKKLVGEKEGCKYYMNIAIVEADWDKFSQLMNENGSIEKLTEEKLAKTLMNSIRPHKDDDFGYKVDNEKALEILSFGYAGICNSNDDYLQSVRDDDSFFVTLKTENPDVDELSMCLGLAQSNPKIEVIEKYGKILQFGKKKSVNLWKNIIPVLVIVVMVVVIIAVITETIKR